MCEGRWASLLRGMLMSVLIGALLSAAPRAAQAAESRVYVLAVAEAESFERGLPKLRFAHDDLARFVKVMATTGATPQARLVALQEPSLAALRSAFAALRAKLADAPKTSVPSKFVFYYTGHSDATGLHLADGLLSKDELHALIAAVPAEARVAFFDGCYSGALAAKGVKPSTDLVVPRAEFDEPSGSVFFAATSGNDVAFELEELGGSLFTHYLVDGLYGAADANHDGLVTVDELYQYVYKQMSALTIALPTARAQTPEYNVAMHGRGALVLAFLARTTVPVTLAADLVGELTMAADGGLQLFRVTKRESEATRVLLVPGDYAVTLRRGGDVGRGVLRVPPSGVGRLALADLTLEKGSDLEVVAKGQRPNRRWGAEVGVTNSSYTRTGPTVEALLGTPAVRVEATEWRLVALAGGRRNDLTYRDQTGVSDALSVVLAVRGSVFPDLRLAGQEWHLLVGGGADYLWQRWDRSGGQTLRTFDSLVPKAVVGLGTELTFSTGRALGLAFRREFPFARDAVSGDVLAFGANVFATTLEW